MTQSRQAAVTGIVLAGGKSRRMGQDKAAMLFAGQTLLKRIVRRLGQATGEVIVIGSPERAQLVPHTRIEADLYPGQGPLGGIATALRVAQTPFIFVVGCDMPFLRPALVRFLVSLAPDHDIVVPRSEHGTEQLHAVYGSACLDIATAALRAGDLAVAALFPRVRTRIVEPHEWAPYDHTGWSLFNANTTEEWHLALAHGAAEDNLA